MKIVIVSESYPPIVSGVAVFSHYLALGLIRRGHEVHVICPSARLKSYDEIHEGITVHRVRARRNPMRKHHKNTFAPRPVVRTLLRSIHPDVVHLQDPLATCKESLKICQKMQIPTVMTNHFAFDYVLSYLPLLKPFHGRIAKFLENYLTNLYNNCDFVTFPSETIRKEFVTNKLTTPARAISNGVDLEQFFPSFNCEEMRQAHHIPHQPIVLHVGRLDQDKRSHEVLEAFALLHQRINCHLVICGEGNMKKQLQEKAVELGLDQHVSFIGFINHRTELPQLYQMASVFTTASTIETQGIVVLEAMASGLPIVTPNAGALPELVQDSVNGYLFKAGSVKQMTDKLYDILSNPKAAKAMGERSLEMVEEHEIEQSITKFETIYTKLILHQSPL